MKIRAVTLIFAKYLFLFLGFLLLAEPESKSIRAAEPLLELAKPGPWSGVSHLIAFNGRIWFANSNPFRNFNAADIYSYAPLDGNSRYERGLASQDVGKPVTLGGQLYWPYEDPRSNLALGEYAITDGSNWVRNVFTQGRALHVHALAACDGLLLAGTGGWAGTLQATTDQGHTWDEVYRFPTPPDRLSRITDVIEFAGHCYFAVTALNIPGPKLFTWKDGQAVAVTGWPEGVEVRHLAVVADHLYGIHIGSEGREIWRFNGEASELIPTPANETIRGFGASDDTLLAITSHSSGGALWEYNPIKTDQPVSDWVKIQTFPDTPIDLLALDGDIYIGMYNQNGRGSLWGPSQPNVLRPGTEATALKPTNLVPIADETILATRRTFEAALQSEGDYSDYRRRIVDISLPLILTRNPKVGTYYSSILQNAFPTNKISTFTGTDYELAEITRWIILNLVAVNGNGRVPVDWIQTPWTRESRPSEKYFDKSLAAIWAVGWIGQNDGETISALIENLTKPDVPQWFQGDNIASLRALTGERFGHDITGWTTWWTQSKSTWPH